jgi:outer membrane protein TolC
LEDRDKEIQEKWESALAELQKWLGSTYVHRELDMEFPQLPTIPVQRELEANLEQHPAVRVSKARVKASENEVEFANAQFRPGWMLDLSYGYRGANRDNVLSAMFIVDLPLFTGKRQGKELSASKADLSAAKNMLDDTRRVYQQKYADGLAAYQRTNERLEFYRTQLLPQAQQNTKATMNAYQSGVTGFNDVVRARLTELTSQLQFLKLQVDQAKAQADLLYLAGG